MGLKHRMAADEGDTASYLLREGEPMHPLPPDGSSRFYRQFELQFTDDELFHAFIVTEDASAARQCVVELRENVARAADYYRGLPATEQPGDEAVVASVSSDTLAILANLSDATAAKVESYMHALWPPSDEDNAEFYTYWKSRRDQLRPGVQARLNELALRPGGG